MFLFFTYFEVLSISCVLENSSKVFADTNRLPTLELVPLVKLEHIRHPLHSAQIKSFLPIVFASIFDFF